MTRTGPGGSQGLETPGSPTWVAGAQELKLLLVASQVRQQGSRSTVQEMKLEPTHLYGMGAQQTMA